VIMSCGRNKIPVWSAGAWVIRPCETMSTTLSQEALDCCPGCGGPADNGHDRCLPPNPYYCTKCMTELGSPRPEVSPLPGNAGGEPPQDVVERVAEAIGRAISEEFFNGCHTKPLKDIPELKYVLARVAIAAQTPADKTANRSMSISDSGNARGSSSLPEGVPDTLNRKPERISIIEEGAINDEAKRIAEWMETNSSMYLHNPLTASEKALIKHVLVVRPVVTKGEIPVINAPAGDLRFAIHKQLTRYGWKAEDAWWLGEKIMETIKPYLREATRESISAADMNLLRFLASGPPDAVLPNGCQAALKRILASVESERSNGA
jgi:hypothetical protein